MTPLPACNLLSQTFKHATDYLAKALSRREKKDGEQCVEGMYSVPMMHDARGFRLHTVRRTLRWRRAFDSCFADTGLPLPSGMKPGAQVLPPR